MNVAGAKYNKKSKELTLYVDAYYYAKYGYSTTEPIHTFVGDNAVILSKDKKVEKINFLTHYEIISYANKYDLKRPEYEDISRKDDLEIVYSNLKEAYQ